MNTRMNTRPIILLLAAAAMACAEPCEQPPPNDESSESTSTDDGTDEIGTEASETSEGETSPIKFDLGSWPDSPDDESTSDGTSDGTSTDESTSTDGATDGDDMTNDGWVCCCQEIEGELVCFPKFAAECEPPWAVKEGACW